MNLVLNKTFLFFSAIIFVTVLSFVSAPSLSAQTVTYNYSGVLKDGDGVPIPNVIIVLQNNNASASVTTGSDGSYSLNVPSGTYQMMIVNHNGATNLLPYGLTLRTQYDIVVNTNIVQNVTVPSEELTITVIDPNGQPLPNAEIFMAQSGVVPVIPIFLGENGNVDGQYMYGYTNASGELTARLIPTTEFYLTLTPPSGTLYTINKTIPFSGTDHVYVSYTTPVVNTISAPTEPVVIDTPITASATFTEQPSNTTHTALWNWGDGNVTAGTVSEQDGAGSVTDTHTYTTSGVYTISLTVIDNYTGQATATFQYVSVYNPTPQGLFTGAKSFTSPAGAYMQSTSLSGKVVFGVSARYPGGAPIGSFSLNFKDANLEFSSTDVNYLVTANGMGSLKGTGTVNGTGNYKFLVTGLDGSQRASYLRVQIKDQANTVIYDTQPGAADAATPTTPVTGQVVVH